jgi:hypothetical protein
MRGRQVAAFLLIASKLNDPVVQSQFKVQKCPKEHKRRPKPPFMLPGPELFLKNYSTFTSICLALASSTFGRVTKSTPCLDSAVIFFVSTNGGSVKLRKNWP